MSQQPLPLGEIASNPATIGISTQPPAAKGSCSCGCMPIKLPFTTPAQSRASPEFKARIQDDAKALLNKAHEVKTAGRTL
jgi:hypothetical protein